MLAAASNAIVVGFNTKITETARRAAEAEGVDVRLYDIIYKLTDDIEAALKGLLEPEVVEVVEGRAEVRQIFRVGKSTVIAGSYVTDGRIVRGGARVWRGGKVIATDRIESLRRFRDDVREVATELRVRHRPRRTTTTSRKATSSSASPSQTRQPRGQPAERRVHSVAAVHAAPSTDEPANGPGRRAPAPGDRRDRRARRRRSADRVRDDHRGRDDAGPPPRQGLGERHRPAGRARRDRRGARPGDAVRPPRARASGCGSSASRTCTSGSTTPPSAARASCSCSTSSRRAPIPDADRAARRVAADAGRPAAARGRPRRRSRRPRSCRRQAAADDGGRDRLARSRRQGAARPPMTVDLAPVPRRASREPSSSGCARARRVLAVSHENPDADTLGAALGDRPARRGAGRRAPTPSAPTRRRRSTTSCRASSASGPTRTRRPTTTSLVISDCGSLERVGEVGVRHADAVRAAAAGRHRPPRLERRGGRGRLDRPGAPRRPARWSTLLAVRLGVAARRRRRGARDRR